MSAQPASGDPPGNLPANSNRNCRLRNRLHPAGDIERRSIGERRTLGGEVGIDDEIIVAVDHAVVIEVAVEIADTLLPILL